MKLLKNTASATIVIVSVLAAVNAQAHPSSEPHRNTLVYPSSASAEGFVAKIHEYQWGYAARTHRSSERVPVKRYVPRNVRATLSKTAQQRLANFASALEKHHWALATSYFPSKHIEGRLGMCLNNELNWGELGKANHKQMQQALRHYLSKGINLELSVRPTEQLAKIRSIRFDAATINHGEQTVTAHFVATLQNGNREFGSVIVDPKTGYFQPEWI